MPSYDHYEHRRRQNYSSSTSRGHTWGHWLPLAITVTVAAGGLAAWIWKERKDTDDDEYHSRPPPRPSAGGPPPSGYGPPSGPGFGAPPGDMPPGGFDGPPPGQASFGPPPSEAREAGEETFVSKMSGAFRRTPSPQQILDGASKRVAAGVAAAGAAVGGALSSITEEDKKRDYEDHRSWSEEAESQSGRTASKSSKQGPNLIENESSVSQQTQMTAKGSPKRRAIAIVVSAVTDYEHDHDASYHQEHAVS